MFSHLKESLAPLWNTVCHVVPRVPQESGRVHGWESVCWGGFQDIDFPRCTIILQDLKDSKLWFSKMNHHVSRNTKISKMLQQKSRFEDLKTFKKFDLPIFTRIYLGSKIIPHVSGSRKFCQDSTMLVFRLFTIVNANWFEPTKICLVCWPRHFQTLTVRIFRRPPFPRTKIKYVFSNMLIFLNVHFQKTFMLS